MQPTVARFISLQPRVLLQEKNFESVKWWRILKPRKVAFCVVGLTRRDETERETKIAPESTDRGLQSMRRLDFWELPPPSWNVPKTIIHWIKKGFRGSVGVTFGRKLGPEDGTIGLVVSPKIPRSVEFYKGGIFYPAGVAFECNVTICDGDWVPDVPV